MFNLKDTKQIFRSPHFRKVFLIRFFSYFFISWGTLTLLLIVEPVFTEEAGYNFNQLFGIKHTLAPKVVTSAEITSARQLLERSLTPTPEPGPSSFGGLLGGGTSIITPVSTDFGIVIEKINANAKVIPQVDPTNEAQYAAALAQGVAQAKGTANPGEKGNIYLFSHSVDAPWNVVRFNAIFYLLSKLDTGDQISLFYKGRRYDYVVYDKTITKPEDTHFLTQSYDQSVLTLQTCDPPGTLLNRLIVRAKLAGS